MQFQIPQFIDVENKIVGPLTMKQFLYLAAAGGVSFMTFFLFQTWLWFMTTAVLAAIAAALAFIKYNGQPLPKIIFYAFGFFWKPKLYIWKREAEERILEIPGMPAMPRKSVKEYFSQMPSVKKLWTNLMTTKEPIAKREKGMPFLRGQAKDKFAVIRKITGEKEVARRVDYR